MKKIILNNHRPKDNLLIKYFITLACNNRCPYCFMLPELNNKLKFNKEIFELFKTKINQLKQNVKLEILGGDPLFINEINRLSEFDTNIVKDIILYSNCNFNPIKFQTKINSFQFSCKFIVSIHKVSNLDYVKQNILYLQTKNMIEEILFILDENSIEEVHDFINFFEVNNLKYVIDLVRKDGIIVENESTKKIFLDHYKEKASNYKINNIYFTEKEIIEYDLYNIAEYFTVKCFTNEISVDYYGNISMNCNHPYTSHIKDGFKVIPLLCNNKRCDCAYAQYKELLYPKDDNQITKFILDKVKKDKS